MAQHVFIDTAQNVKLTYELSGLGSRIIAYIIDMIIKGAYIALISFLLVLISDGIMNMDETVLVIILFFAALPVVFYSFLFETFYQGQTPGKKAAKIRVVKLDGSAPGIGNYFMRWIFRIVDIQLFSGLVAIITIASSKNGQHVGDMAAGTTVISLNRDIRLEDIKLSKAYEEGYVPTYPEVMKLSDKDMEIIRQLTRGASTSQNEYVLKQVVEKVMEITGITTIHQTEMDFLHTVMNDYNYYANTYDN
ncbi:MAG: RDD family protein [Candidatus Azobacteroides sp.]|nr:RDD family protein [Candidatus Azobacteroides sp.]